MKAPSGKGANVIGPSKPVTTTSGISKPSSVNQITSPTKGVTGKPCPKPGQGNQIQGPLKGK